MKFLKKNKKQGRQMSQQRGPSAPVVRYYRPQNTVSKHIEVKSNSNKDERTPYVKRVFQITGRWFGVILIIALLLANTSISNTGVQIVGENQNYRPSEEYKQAAQAILRSSLLNRSKLTLSSNSFEQRLYEEFPEITSASVIIPLAGRKLQVHVQMAHPLARLIAGGNQQAVVSDNGTVVRLASAESINAAFRDLPALSMPNLSVREGQQVLTAAEAGLITLLIDEFDGSETLRPKVESIEFDVLKREIKTRFIGTKYFAKLTPEREARGQVGSLAATVKDLTGKNVPINEYIDVRVDGRVFVR